MSKRILEWLRQRRVAVTYGLICFPLLGVTAYVVWMTRADISLRVDEAHVAPLWKMYGLPLYFLCALTGLGVMKFWRQSGLLLTMRLLLITVYLAVFKCVFDFLGDARWAFYIGEGKPQLGLVSTYEVAFIYVLFVVGSLFQWIMIKFEARRAEMNTVVGGVLIIMGILMPKVLESYSMLQAYCNSGRCSPEASSWSILFEMAIAYASSLSMMFVLGVFSSSVKQAIRRCVDFGEAKGLESSPVALSRGDVRVSTGESAASSDEQNDGVELTPGSSSTAARVPQEAADGVVPRVCSEETSARPTVSLASSSVSRGDDEGLTRPMESVMGPVGVSVPVESSSGSGSVAVSKQLMSAAVSGLVAGACFSVASRLFNRR